MARTSGAIGWLIGEENRGLEYMFTMMNSARLNVGLQGVAIAERAYQQARDYRANPGAGPPVGAAPKRRAPPIIHHPDVRRMLLCDARRDRGDAGAGLLRRRGDRPAPAPSGGGERARAAQRRADLLIPVVKAWCTDLGVAVASTGIQVHGGMGFIEETGAAQHLRDARIAPIYEGTNGIQANDLVGRKLARDARRSRHGADRRDAGDGGGARRMPVQPTSSRLPDRCKRGSRRSKRRRRSLSKRNRPWPRPGRCRTSSYSALFARAG